MLKSGSELRLRDLYLNRLIAFQDTEPVKIITGIRRCGKSSLMKLMILHLRDTGVADDQIIEMNFESMDFRRMTVEELYRYVKERLPEKKRAYLFFDEIQRIDQWQDAVNSFRVDFDCDIYVTGSNSKLMSSEISTYLTGRYVSIPVYTLSFKEYLDFKADSTLSRRELLEEYIRFGGFPIVALSEYDEQSAYQIVNGIYHTVVSRDIVKRHRINKQDLFDRVVKYIIENMGKTFSANSISTFLKSEHRKVSVESIYNYLRWLEQAFIIYPCERYDLQGKSILKTQEKYYLADVSLKYALLGYNRKMLDGAMENIVYLELKRRGYDVYIGKNDTKEIDFVATRRDERIYVQVCVRIPEASDREVGNLMEIRDHYPKYVVTLNEMDTGIEDGIRIVHLADFLLAEQW